MCEPSPCDKPVLDTLEETPWGSPIGYLRLLWKPAHSFRPTSHNSRPNSCTAVFGTGVRDAHPCRSSPPFSICSEGNAFGPAAAQSLARAEPVLIDSFEGRLALGGAAGLAYLPFSQRTWMRKAYPKSPSSGAHSAVPQKEGGIVRRRQALPHARVVGANPTGSATFPP